ncbi:MAG: thermonuclease family protein [Candidatus Pacearchaeota archaeon]
MSIKRVIVFFSIIVIMLIFSYFYPTLTGKIVTDKEQALLLRVIDGDTIEVLYDDNPVKVRLLGINTPEKNMPFSNESKNFLRRFENKTLILEADFEDTDKYGRKLRYAFYKDTFLNQEILENGFANAYYYAGLKYEKKLLEAEKRARENERGIWQKSYEACAVCIKLKELNEKEEYFILENKCAFICNLNGWFVKDSGRNIFKLSSINAKTQIRINSTKETWNQHDKFFLFDPSGLLVIYYEY